MKKLLAIALLALLIGACQEEEPNVPEEFGFLSLGISVQIESEPASGRMASVDTDSFKITIFTSEGLEYLVIDTYVSAPDEIQLPTGEYYVEAHSNDLVESAFDSPYYFGRSENFTVDKEETVSVAIEASLANCKVVINYSENVLADFDSLITLVSVTNSGSTLPYVQDESREGYFVLEPLAINIYLAYNKLDGGIIDHTFTASIPDPQPATLYQVNVDASLDDGAIVLDLTVDESVDTVNINVGDVSVSTIDGCILEQYFVFEDTDLELWQLSYTGDGLIETIDKSDNYSTDSHQWTFIYGPGDRIDRATATGTYHSREEFMYDGNDDMISRDRYRDYGSGWEYTSREEFTYNSNHQLINLKEFDIQDDSPVLDVEYVYTYSDNSNNPDRADYYNSVGTLFQYRTYAYDTTINLVRSSGLWICNNCLDFEFLPFTDNNVLSQNTYLPDASLDGTVTMSYNYNQYGYPTAVLYESSNGESFSQVYDLECEGPQDLDSDGDGTVNASEFPGCAYDPGC